MASMYKAQINYKVGTNPAFEIGDAVIIKQRKFVGIVRSLAIVAVAPNAEPIWAYTVQYYNDMISNSFEYAQHDLLLDTEINRLLYL